MNAASPLVEEGEDKTQSTTLPRLRSVVRRLLPCLIHHPPPLHQYPADLVIINTLKLDLYSGTNLELNIAKVGVGSFKRR